MGLAFAARASTLYHLRKAPLWKNQLSVNPCSTPCPRRMIPQLKFICPNPGFPLSFYDPKNGDWHSASGEVFFPQPTFFAWLPLPREICTLFLLESLPSLFSKALCAPKILLYALKKAFPPKKILSCAHIVYISESGCIVSVICTNGAVFYLVILWTFRASVSPMFATYSTAHTLEVATFKIPQLGLFL